MRRQHAWIGIVTVACIISALTLAPLQQATGQGVAEETDPPQAMPVPPREWVGPPPEQAVGSSAHGQPMAVVGGVLRPENAGFSEENLRQLQMPEGFEVGVFATDLGRARWLAVAEDGTVFVSSQAEGEVTALRDTNGDGRADWRRVVAEELEMIHGLAYHDGKLYMAAPTRLWVADFETSSGELRNRELLFDDLPDGGQHPNRTLGFSPDGVLFINVGSSCNACEETNPEHATMLRVDLENRTREVFARGLRNTTGFGWHPQTGVLWGMDHGSDMRGDDIPPEELNRIEQGKHYGWPWVYGQQEIDPFIDHPPDTTKQAFAEQTEPMVMGYQAHASAIGFTFYTGDGFPEAYRHDAFVAFRGSWNRVPPVGYEVVRVVFDDEGEPQRFEPFITGFLLDDGRRHFARLAGITQAADGSLLFCDDTNGIVYRVTYTGDR